MTYLIATFLAMAGLSWTAFAQDNPAAGADSARSEPQPSYEAEPVEVTATRYARPVYRVPYAVDQLSTEDIQRAEAGLSLEETLRSLPGVLVNNRFNASQGDRISMRGIGSRAAFGVRGLKLVQDGVPLTTADGQSQLNNVDLTSTGQIEVIRGPSSSLYGNAAGGIIQLTTQPASDTPFELQPRYMAGSDGLYRWQGKASGQLGRHQYILNVTGVKLDGYRDHAYTRSAGVNAVGKHRLADALSLTSVFNFYDAPYQFNPSSLARAVADTAPTSVRLFVQQQGASKKVRQGQGGVTLQYRGETHQAEATVYGLGRTLYNPIPGAVVDLSRKGGGIRGVYSRLTRWGGASLRVSAGADVDLQSDRRQEFGNDGIPNDQVGRVKDERIFALVRKGAPTLNQDEQVLGAGPFMELEISPRPQIVVTAGGRYDRFRFKVDDNLLTDNTDDSGVRTMDAFSPMLGLTYRPLPFLSFYGSFATAFQTPTTTELSNQPTREGGFNPDLNPERQRGFEAGFKGTLSRRRLSWDAAFFAFRISDMLIPFQIDDPASEEIYFRNAGKTQNLGMELKLAWAPHPTLRATLAYTGMRFEFKDFAVEHANVAGLVQLAGNRVPGVPPHHLFGGLAYTHPAGAFLETNVQWVAAYFANDFNGPPPGSTTPSRNYLNRAYGLLDLRLGMQRRFGAYGFEYFLGINNLLDTRYSGSIVPNAAGDRFFEPAAGRTWYTGIGVPLAAGSR